MTMNEDERVQLAKRRERLRPELAEYLIETPVGLTLNHPLVNYMGVDPDHAALQNEWHRDAVERVSDAHSKRDWSSFVFLHTRPYRFDALFQIVHELSNKQYWRLVSDVWSDSDNIWQNLEEWRELWNERRPCKHHAMDATERKTFTRLPREITIYRGFLEGHSADGISWSLDRNKAIWFAKRYTHFDLPHVLLTARAYKPDAHAMLLSRNENEVVIDQFEIVAKEYVTADETEN